MGLLIKLYKDHAGVIGYTGKNTVVEIPETHNFLPVTVIEDSAFKENPYVEKIYLPNSLISIQGSAFYHCSSLHKIGTRQDLDGPSAEIYMGENARIRHGEGCCCSVFPTDLDEIGPAAFAGTRLEDVYFRSSFVFLGDRAFEGCRSLDRVLFRIGADLTIGNRCFKDSGVSCFIAISQDPIYVQSEAFMNCFQLDSVCLRAWGMGARVFAHCYNLRQVQLSHHMKSMLQDCFLECWHLDASAYLPYEKKETDYTAGEWLEADLDDSL